MTLSSDLEMSDQFVPPLLQTALEHLDAGFQEFLKDAQAQKELHGILLEFAGRPTPLTFAKNLSRKWGGTVYLKREDLLHGGAHKLNNALGQCYLAKRMGFDSIIAETGAGQHGVATAMAGAKLGLKVVVFQGKKDVERQRANALRMRLFGADLRPVEEGSGTLKEAVNAAFRHWVATCQNTAYCLGSIVGPKPYPGIVRHFQKIIGSEARAQFLATTQQLPNGIFACVGGGSNAAGIYSGFLDDSFVKFYGCEAAGAASLSHGSWGVLHGMKTLLLQTENGQIAKTKSVSAGLDYPGVGPWLAGLKEEGRLKPLAISDDDCLAALMELAQEEGILSALESAHALAGAKQHLAHFPGQKIVINISGRGDKDLDILFAKGMGAQ